MRQQFDGQMNALLRVVIAEVPSAPQLARDAYQNGVLARYDQIRQVIEELVARGDLKPHNLHDGARHLGGMVKEFVVWLHSSHRLSSWTTSIPRSTPASTPV